MFVVPANHKKLPIRKIKLPQNFHATRYFDLFCIQMKPMHQSRQIVCKKPVFENLFNVTCEQCRFSSLPSERAFARKRTERNAVGPLGIRGICIRRLHSKPFMKAFKLSYYLYNVSFKKTSGNCHSDSKGKIIFKLF